MVCDDCGITFEVQMCPDCGAAYCSRCIVSHDCDDLDEWDPGDEDDIPSYGYNYPYYH